jgi:DNA-directed RNA polymerase specialized sigma24 family protein
VEIVTSRPPQAVREDFESWLVAREHVLQRTALLLTGDPHSAQDLVQITLAKLYLAWDRIGQRERVDAYARRVLVNEHRSAWRRPWRRHEVATEVLPGGGAMTATEERLRQSLRARADRAAFEPTPVLEVARRARELRRRRRGQVLVAATAAAAALAVPAGLLLVPDDVDRTPSPAGPTVTIGSLSDLPTGAPPTADYLLDRTYVFADGRRVELDVDPGSVLDAVPSPGGVLVTTPSPASSPAGIAAQRWFGPGGRALSSGCGGEQLALSGNGELAAYVHLEGGCDSWTQQPTLAWGPTAGAEADRVDIVTPNGERVEPVGVSVDRVLYNVSDPTGGEQPRRVYTTEELGPPVEVRGITRAAAWDPVSDRVAGCPADGPCVVVTEGDGAVGLTLDPHEEPLSFSPDGRYLATATGQGERSTTVTIRDSRTGDVVVALAGDDASFQGDASSVAWEDVDHLLVARVDADGEALVRLGVDGSTALATPVTDPSIGGYVLPGA